MIYTHFHKPYPITREQFPDAFRKGLGRALLYTKEHCTEGFDELILEHCLHNLAYDPWWEEDYRPAWLYEFIRMSKKEDWYWKHIREAVVNPKDHPLDKSVLSRLKYLGWLNERWDIQKKLSDHDTKQLTNLVLYFAKDGYREAKELLYFLLERQVPFLEHRIIELEGTSSILRIAEIQGNLILKGINPGIKGFLLDDFTEEEQQECWKQMEESSLNNEAIKNFLYKFRKHYAYEHSENRDENMLDEEDRFICGKTIVRPTAEEILRIIYSGSNTEDDIDKIEIFSLFTNNERDNEQKRIVYEAFLKEEKQEYLYRYFEALDGHAPFYHDRLLELAASEDDGEQSASIAMLSNFQSEKIRDLALRLLQKKSESFIRNRGIRLLLRNFESGDEILLESILFSLKDIHLIHSAGSSLIKTYPDTNMDRLMDCYLWMYENTPCAECRDILVNSLDQEKILPEWIAKEFPYDCYGWQRNSGIKEMEPDQKNPYSGQQG